MDVGKIYKLIDETGYIQSIKLEREMGAYSTKELQMTLVISACPYYIVDKKLKLTFNNLSGLELNNIDNLFHILLEITSLHGRQLEYADFFVEEIENNMFSFYCESFNYETI